MIGYPALDLVINRCIASKNEAYKSVKKPSDISVIQPRFANPRWVQNDPPAS